MVHRIFLHSKNWKELYSRNVTLLSACGRKQHSSDSKSGDHEGPGSTFREKMIKKHFYPSEKEGIDLTYCGILDHVICL